MKYYNVYFVNVYSDEALQGLNVATVLMPDNISKDKIKKIAKNLNQASLVFLTKLDSEIYEAYYYCYDEEVNFSSYATIGLFYTLADKGYIQALENGKKEIILHTKYGKVYVELNYINYEIDSVYIRFSVTQVDAKLNSEELIRAFNIDKSGLAGLSHIKAYKDNISSPSILIEFENKENLQKIVPNLEIIKEISNRENVNLINLVSITGENEIEQRSFKISNDIYEVYDLKASIYSFLFYLSKEGRINFDKEIRVNKDIVFSLSSLEDGTIRIGGKAHVYLSGVLSI